MKRTNLQFNIDPRLITKVKDGEKRAAYYYLNNQTYIVGAVPSCHIQSCFFDIVLMESFIYRDEIYLYGKDHLDVNEEYNNTLVLYFYGRTQQDWVAQDEDFRCWNLLIETENGIFYLKSDPFLTDAFIQPTAILQNGQSGKQVFVKGFIIDRDILQTISSAKEIKFSVSGISNIPLEPDGGLDYDNFVEGLTFTIDVRVFALHAQNFINAISLTEQEDNCLKQRDSQININPLLVTKVRNNIEKAAYYLSNKAYPVGAVPSCHIQSCFFNLALMESFEYWTEKEELYKNKEYKDMPVLYFYGRMQQDWMAAYCHVELWDLLIETDKGNFFLRPKWTLLDAFVLPPAIVQGTRDSRQNFIQGYPVDLNILQAISSARHIKFTISGISIIQIDSESEEEYCDNSVCVEFTNYAEDLSTHARNFLAAISPTEQGTSRLETEAQTQQAEGTHSLGKQNNRKFNFDPRLVTKVWNGEEKAIYYLNCQACSAGAVPACHIQSCFFNIALLESFSDWTEKEFLYLNEEYKNMLVLYFYGRMQPGWVATKYRFQSCEFLLETDNGKYPLESKKPLRNIFMPPSAITQKVQISDQYFIWGFPIDRSILQDISSAGQIKFTISGIANAAIKSNGEVDDDNAIRNLTFTIDAEGLSTHARNFLAAISPAEQGAS